MNAAQQTPGTRIRQARHAAGMTQGALARAAGVSERNVVRWENDQHTPRVEHLTAIAKATGHDLGFFLASQDEDEDEDSSRAVKRSLADDLLQLSRMASLMDRRPGILEDILAAEQQS